MGVTVAGSRHLIERKGQRKSIIAHHTTAEEAGKLFSIVKPKLAVYSHIVPGDAKDLLEQTRKSYAGPLEVGEDLMNFDVGTEVGVHRPH